MSGIFTFRHRSRLRLPKIMPLLLLYALLGTFFMTSNTVHSQPDSTAMFQSQPLTIGLTFRALGNRTLGFYSFTSMTPEAQVYLGLRHNLAAGLHFRYAIAKSELVTTTIFDPSAAIRLLLGPGYHSFLKAGLRRAFVNTEWNRPLGSPRRNPVWGIRVGAGRQISLFESQRISGIVSGFYEYLKTDGGEWNGSYNLDLGLSFKL